MPSGTCDDFILWDFVCARFWIGSAADGHHNIRTRKKRSAAETGGTASSIRPMTFCYHHADVERRLSFCHDQSRHEGFQSPLPEHVVGCVLVLAEPPCHDGRTDVCFYPAVF